MTDQTTDTFCRLPKTAWEPDHLHDWVTVRNAQDTGDVTLFYTDAEGNFQWGDVPPEQVALMLWDALRKAVEREP